MLGKRLGHRKAEAAARGGGVIFRDISLAVQRVDAQADVERLARGAKPVEQRPKARDLDRRFVLGRRSTELHRHSELRTGTVPSRRARSEEHTSELQSLMRISYAVFCLKKKK